MTEELIDLIVWREQNGLEAVPMVLTPEPMELKAEEFTPEVLIQKTFIPVGRTNEE